MFRKLALCLAVMAGLIAQLAVPASAAIGVDAAGLRDSLAESSPVANAQFVSGGRNYCWYNSAWNGPGWYWCGYPWRRGIGWGGAAGWRGWRHPGVVHNRHHGVRHRPVHRPVHRPAHRPVHRHNPHRPAHRPVHRPGHNRPNHHRPAGRPSGGHRGGGHQRGGQRRSR